MRWRGWSARWGEASAKSVHSIFFGRILSCGKRECLPARRRAENGGRPTGSVLARRVQPSGRCYCCCWFPRALLSTAEIRGTVACVWRKQAACRRAMRVHPFPAPAYAQCSSPSHRLNFPPWIFDEAESDVSTICARSSVCAGQTSMDSEVEFASGQLTASGFSFSPEAQTAARSAPRLM